MSIIVIIVFASFMLIVYLPQLTPPPAHAALSILSDCTDERTAMVNVIVRKSAPAEVDVSLEDSKGAFSPGTCTTLQVQFPGKTEGEAILSDQTYERPGVPVKFLKLVDAGPRLKKKPGMGDGVELSLNLLGAPPVPPKIHFLWVDATTQGDFATNRISLPLAPIEIHGSSLVPIKHVKVEMAVPNDLKNATSSPTPNATIPLGNMHLDQHDFAKGASVVSLNWTDDVRRLVKEVGVVVFSLLAGAAISDLLTARPEPKVDAAPSTKARQNLIAANKRRKKR